MPSRLVALFKNWSPKTSVSGSHNLAPVFSIFFTLYSMLNCGSATSTGIFFWAANAGRVRGLSCFQTVKFTLSDTPLFGKCKLHLQNANTAKLLQYQAVTRLWTGNRQIVVYSLHWATSPTSAAERWPSIGNRECCLSIARSMSQMLTADVAFCVSSRCTTALTISAETPQKWPSRTCRGTP